MSGRPVLLLPTILLSLVLGTLIGVILLLLFRGGERPTVSAVNAGMPGTTVSAPASGSGTSSPATTSTSSAEGEQNEATDGTTQAATSDEHPQYTAFKGSGAELYAEACQSCHMPGGKGADGAGRYPALANNARVASVPYVAGMILNGNGGMPGFSHYLSDEQIAQIVNYVRTDLNGNTDEIKASDIQPLRPQQEDELVFGESAG